MKFTKSEVIALAELARLDLSPAEIDLFGRQFSSILEFIDVLNKVEIPNDWRAISEQKNVWRSDQAVPWDEIERELALSQGERDSGLIIAPKVL